MTDDRIMKTWDEFIAKKLVNDLDVTQMINEYEEFTKFGIIGDCLLRSTADDWQKNLGCYVSVTNTMGNIATECYKKFARYWMEQL